MLRCSAFDVFSYDTLLIVQATACMGTAKAAWDYWSLQRGKLFRPIAVKAGRKVSPNSSKYVVEARRCEPT